MRSETKNVLFVMFAIVRGVSCVLLGSTEAALLENFMQISRRFAKCAMTTAWLHSGVLRAPLCIQGDAMAHFAGQREIGVKFPMIAASVDHKSTQHASLTICASDFHPSRTRTKSTPKLAASPPTLRAGFRVSELWNSLANNVSQGF